MPLLLAIEPDARQAACLTALVPAHLTANLVLVSSVDDALAALQQRRPDLVLTTPCLSASDEAVLMARLGGSDAHHSVVPTLAIPRFAGDPTSPRRPHGLLARLRRPRSRRGTPDCEPAAFAAQITECLALADAVRRACAQAATGGTLHPTLPESDEATAAMQLRVIAESDRADDPAVDAGWLDLEPYLDDETMAAKMRRAHDADGLQEPDVIELPPPDELWAQLAPGYAVRMAPLEGPSMAPRAPHATTHMGNGDMAATGAVGGPLRLVPARTSSDRPMQDEWGLYDPEQCGFAALRLRLEELADDDRRDQERGTPSAIIRR